MYVRTYDIKSRPTCEVGLFHKIVTVGRDAFHDVDIRSRKMNFGDMNYQDNI